MPRLFVSLPLPEAVRDAMVRLQHELRPVLPPGTARWARREQLHVTLRFLGEVADGSVPGVLDALRRVGATAAPLDLRAERVGVFPDLRFPRVAWAWVHDDAGQLPALHRAVDAAVGPFSGGAPEKKAFVGHVTLARIDGLHRPGAEALAAWVHGKTGERFGQWRTAEITLMRSQLGPGGAVHAPVETVALEG